MDEQFIDACEIGNLDLVKSLSVSVESGSLPFAICWAAMYGNLPVVVYLVSIGADFNADDGLPIRWASMNGHFTVVKYLLSLGATIGPSDVSIASDNGHFEIVKYIIDTCGVSPTTLSEQYQAYLLFCSRMIEKKQIRAQKKIYFWWIPICYDMKNECGKRMANHNLQMYRQILGDATYCHN